jgi:phosphohistidine swiveling domain-containing protein
MRNIAPCEAMAPDAPVGETEWVREDLFDLLPELTSPQALGAFETLLNLAGGDRSGWLGAPDASIAPMAASFGGRLYLNAARLRQRRRLRAARAVRNHALTCRRLLRELASVDPRELSDFEVWSSIEHWYSEAPAHIEALLLLLVGVRRHQAAVRRVCDRVGLPCERLVDPPLAADDRSPGAQQAVDLLALVAASRAEPAAVASLLTAHRHAADLRRALRETTFPAAFDAFLEAHGHRGPYEYDWSRPGYREDPTPILEALRLHLQRSPDTDVAVRAGAPTETAKEVWSTLAARVPLWKRWITLAHLRRAMRTIRRYAQWRDQVRSDLVRVLSVLRVWHLALAERFVDRRWLEQRDDYFLLLFGEIAPIINGQTGAVALRTIVADRVAERERHRGLRMPAVLRVSELPVLMRATPDGGHPARGAELVGRPVSDGGIEADVVVLDDPGDVARMRPGAILVARAVDSAWTPLLTLASGLILELGTSLSPIAILARELGLPALGDVSHATTRLSTGERVRLDATHGRVYRLSA